ENASSETAPNLRAQEFQRISDVSKFDLEFLIQQRLIISQRCQSEPIWTAGIPIDSSVYATRPNLPVGNSISPKVVGNREEILGACRLLLPVIDLLSVGSFLCTRINILGKVI